MEEAEGGEGRWGGETKVLFSETVHVQGCLVGKATTQEGGAVSQPAAECAPGRGREREGGREREIEREREGGRRVSERGAVCGAELSLQPVRRS